MKSSSGANVPRQQRGVSVMAGEPVVAELTGADGGRRQKAQQEQRRGRAWFSHPPPASSSWATRLEHPI